MEDERRGSRGGRCVSLCVLTEVCVRLSVVLCCVVCGLLRAGLLLWKSNTNQISDLVENREQQKMFSAPLVSDKSKHRQL